MRVARVVRARSRAKLARAQQPFQERRALPRELTPELVKTIRRDVILARAAVRVRSR
jgi:hypothetical protein